MIALVVPVLKRFDLFTKLMTSVDELVLPIIIPNYINNLGVAASWNKGILLAAAKNCDVAIVANDDVVFNPGTIKEMAESLRNSDGILLSPNHNGEMENVGMIDGANFFCFAVKPKEFIETVGHFDENIYPAYFEDNDMHYRINLANSKSYIHTGIPVNHEGSATQNADENNPVVPSARFEAIRSYYIRKWGGEPGKEKYVTPWNRSGLNIKAWKGQDSVDENQIELDNFFEIGTE